VNSEAVIRDIDAKAGDLLFCVLSAAQVYQLAGLLRVAREDPEVPAPARACVEDFLGQVSDYFEDSPSVLSSLRLPIEK